VKRRSFFTLTVAGISAPFPACKKAPNVSASGKPIIRFGHFPNVTHVQALVAHQLSRRGKGWFEEKLGAEIEWFVYNAGPSATEAIFAGALDVTYIGPSPVLNAYAKSKGMEMRVLAGAANGGSALVVRADAGIGKPEDFRGKKVATPQLGNTQDVQARAYLMEHGLKITQTGGDAFVIPTQNPDQLALMVKKELDAVWTVEPWVTRLELEAGAKVFVEDKDTGVTMLAARAAWVDEQKDLAKRLVAAHHALTEWIKANPGETKALVKAELTDEKLPPKDAVLDRAIGRVIVTGDVSRESLDKMVRSAQAAGFLKDIPALDKLLPAL
jgi:NitT/TauT family transport system substrate-binding protein